MHVDVKRVPFMQNLGVVPVHTAAE